MFRTLLPALISLAVASPLPTHAQDFFTRELLVIPVRPIDANTFEMIENDGAGGSQMWCAAGKYTRDYLGQRGGDIAVLVPRGPSGAVAGRKSVIFTTAPVAQPVTSTSQGIRTAGQTFSMAHAYALCRSQPELLIRLRILAPS